MFNITYNDMVQLTNIHEESYEFEDKMDELLVFNFSESYGYKFSQNIENKYNHFVKTLGYNNQDYIIQNG